MQQNISTTTKIWVSASLLLIAFVFWIFSEQYVDKKISGQLVQSIEEERGLSIGEPISDIEIDKALDDALKADTEIELRAIDEEF